MPRPGGAGTIRAVPFLSPAKLLIILVVALIVLGPDKLPKLARQIGGLWGDFRKLRERLESGVRDNFPDLPSTETISQAVRSPITFLDNLADSHAVGQEPSTDESPPIPEAGDGGGEGDGDTIDALVTARRPSIPGISITESGGAVHQVRSNGRALPDDPGLN